MSPLTAATPPSGVHVEACHDDVHARDNSEGTRQISNVEIPPRTPAKTELRSEMSDFVRELLAEEIKGERRDVSES